MLYRTFGLPELAALSPQQRAFVWREFIDSKLRPRGHRLIKSCYFFGVVIISSQLGREMSGHTPFWMIFLMIFGIALCGGIALGFADLAFARYYHNEIRRFIEEHSGELQAAASAPRS